jgi:hypothetical protein
MTNQPALRPLLSWLTTTHQAKELLQLIDLKLVQLATLPNTQTSLTKVLSNFPSVVVESWPLIFTDTPATLKLAPSQLSTQLTTLQKMIINLPKATLTIAFTPTLSQTQQYLTTLRAHLDEMLIVEIIIDEHIIGGCQLAYQGQKFSSTLKDILESL